jgi:photosystem II stability/assembly factor-like uncharacterized protein
MNLSNTLDFCQKKRRTLNFWGLLFSALISFAGTAQAESVQKPAVISSLSSKVLLTDSAKVGGGGRYVGVGIYGTVIYSSDIVNWQQANTPTQILLTAVFFIDDKLGWAGGHDSLILHTKDGGETWVIQYEDPIPGDDIPKPILDILFTDAKTGYAIGAYAYVLATTDGGNSWQKVDTLGLFDRLLDMDMEPEPNFNQIINFDGKFLIAAELGTLLLFDPNGETDEQRWHIMSSPYLGTYFGATQTSSGDLYLYGLRGNIYRTTDAGDNWQKIETNVITNIYDCIELTDGRIVFLGASGTILTMTADDTDTQKYPYEGFDTFVSGEVVTGSQMLLFGAGGVKTLVIENDL